MRVGDKATSVTDPQSWRGKFVSAATLTELVLASPSRALRRSWGTRDQDAAASPFMKS